MIDAIRRQPCEDDGFTLIEVITAILVISILATSGLWFYLNGNAIANSQERRQLAVTVANEAMETVRGATLTQNPVTGFNAVYTGREKSATQAAFRAAAGVSGVSITEPVWDTTARVGAVPNVPFSRTITRSGTNFYVRTLVGACYQRKAGGECGLLSSIVPPNTPTKLTRVIVAVSWTAGPDCSTGGCSYAVSALIDNNSDLLWVG